MRNVLLALLALFALISAPVYAEDAIDADVNVEAPAADEAPEALPPMEDPNAGNE